MEQFVPLGPGSDFAPLGLRDQGLAASTTTKKVPTMGMSVNSSMFAIECDSLILCWLVLRQLIKLSPFLEMGLARARW